MNIAYVRVSSADQNEARQIEALKKHGIDKWFSEKVSGKNTDRPKLQELLDFVRSGDTLYIHDFSRLARSTKDLLRITDLLTAKGVAFYSDKEQIDTSTPAGRLMLTMIGAIAEFERQTILDRQREGIELAKKAGKYRGRHSITLRSCPTFGKYYAEYMNRRINKGDFAKLLNVSRPTLNRLIAEYQGTKND